MSEQTSTPPEGRWRERLASLETEVEAMQKLVDEVRTDLKALRDLASSARGAVYLVGVVWALLNVGLMLLLRSR